MTAASASATRNGGIAPADLACAGASHPATERAGTADSEASHVIAGCADAMADSVLAERDPFGFDRLFFHPSSGTYGNGIRSILSHAALPPGKPDAAAIDGFFKGQRLPGHTVLQDVRAVPPGHALLRTRHGLTVHLRPETTSRGDAEALLPVPLPMSRQMLERDAQEADAQEVDAQQADALQMGLQATQQASLETSLQISLQVSLKASLQTALQTGKNVALALSGGLDSALLLALLHDMGARHIPVYILATGLPDYCERDAALAVARRLHAEAVVIDATADDFVAALPAVIRHIEEPLYNLHPVAKLLLARAMRRDGIDIAISGDGADQVLTRDVSADYLPLCHALFDAAGVTLHAPFLDAAVVRHLVSIAPDAHKQCLRDLAALFDLPSRLVSGPKRSRLAPAMDLSAWLDRPRIVALAHALDRPAPDLSADAQRVLWTTLLLTLDHLGVHP